MYRLLLKSNFEVACRYNTIPYFSAYYLYSVKMDWFDWYMLFLNDCYVDNWNNKTWSVSFWHDKIMHLNIDYSRFAENKLSKS